MANIFPLRKGLKVGDTIHKECEIREAAGADIIDGSTEAEELRLTPGGWALVSSPALAEMHILRRQIVRIGDHEGPLTLAELKTSGEALKSATREDLARLPPVAEALDRAETQLQAYRQSLDRRYGSALELRAWAVVALGLERLVARPLENG